MEQTGSPAKVASTAGLGPLVERLRAFVALDGGDIADVEEAANALERMQNWIEGDCNCPCCSESRECLDGCTFAADCPDGAERMAGAREALFGA